MNSEKLTYSVPEAGGMAGLGRSASYEAARRGEIPTLKFGRIERVPKALWDAILRGDYLKASDKSE